MCYVKFKAKASEYEFSLMRHDEYCKIEDVLRILETELALIKADEIRKENRKREEEYRKKLRESNNADM